MTGVVFGVVNRLSFRIDSSNADKSELTGETRLNCLCVRNWNDDER